jgi:hypothetical protein
MGAGRNALCAALAMAGAAALACSSTSGTRTVYPELDAADTDPQAGYESPPVLRASDLLPPELISGPHHRVEEAVVTDGFTHTYTIGSDYGTFVVTGDDMLRTRVREIEAIAALDEASGTEEFAKAAGRALASPFVATYNLVTDPVGSITGVPRGAWDALKRTGDLTGGERSELEDGSFRELIGFGRVKRKLARELGVDPYSSNEELQKRLNRHAWAAYAGGLPGLFVPFTSADDGAERAGVASTSEARLEDLLRHYSPEDLRRLNRIELAVMGIPEELTERFISHPWYSPRHATLLIGALSALDLASDRAVFIEQAVAAESEDDAFFYQRVAQMMRAYHERRDGIRRIVPLGRRAVAGYTEHHALVAPFLADHAVWTRPTADFARRLAGAELEDADVARKELVLSGTLSEKARSEIEALGIDVTDRAFERLEPAPEPGAPAEAENPTTP